MRTTKKEISNYNAIDVSNWTDYELNELREKEQSFRTIAVAVGIYGINAKVIQGTKSKELYKYTNRGNARWILG